MQSINPLSRITKQIWDSFELFPYSLYHECLISKGTNFCSVLASRIEGLLAVTTGNLTLRLYPPPFFPEQNHFLYSYSKCLCFAGLIIYLLNRSTCAKMMRHQESNQIICLERVDRSLTFCAKPMLPREVYHVKPKPPSYAGKVSEPRQGVDEMVWTDASLYRE